MASGSPQLSDSLALGSHCAGMVEKCASTGQRSLGLRVNGEGDGVSFLGANRLPNQSVVGKQGIHRNKDFTGNGYYYCLFMQRTASMTRYQSQEPSIVYLLSWYMTMLQASWAARRSQASLLLSPSSLFCCNSCCIPLSGGSLVSR